MAVVVSEKGVQVKAIGKYYGHGEVIQGLSDSSEKRLVDEGHCEYPITVANTQDNPVKEEVSDSTKGGPETGHPLVGDEDTREVEPAPGQESEPVEDAPATGIDMGNDV